MTRTNKSIRNVVYALLMSVGTIVVGLIAQRVFIHTLGAEYLGINGLFTSIVSMLALVELGLSSAIYYHLYKPVAVGDTAMVRSLVDFYKKGYRLIAVGVLLLGMCTVPFLGAIVGETTIPENIYFIYLLFLVDIVCSYLLTYKRAVLYVDQNNHIISMVHLGYLIALNSFQIGILLATENFYLYLIIKIVMRLGENIVLTFITNKKYPYLTDKSVVPLNNATKSEIYKKVRGLSYHKVATYVVLGTDNIIVSLFFGIVTVGLYSNYLLVITAIYAIMSQAFAAITSSIGNLLVSAKSSQSFQVYKKLRLVNLWLSCFAATSLLVVMDSFVTIWIGEQYLLPKGVLVALSLNLYLTLFRSALGSFKEASDIFHQDRFVPIVESVANIVFSLVFLHFFGLAGVFLGTACSTLIVHLFSYPIYVYKPLFEQSYLPYYKDFFKSFFIAVSVAAVTYAISRSLALEGNFITFAVNVLLCLVVPALILFAVFHKSPELKYFTQLFNKSLRTLTKRTAKKSEKTS